MTGLAGLLAGAGSMAMGEWVSVQSARELAGRQLDIEARELEEIPDEEREELALIASGTAAVALSAALSVAGLFAIGALITLFTGRSALFSGGRQVVIGVAAATLTYVVGRLIGGAVGA